MAPEILEGKECDGRADIFALGVVLYEMATGERPFKGESPAALAAGILRDEPIIDRLAPPAFAQIVARCLAKRPAERWQSARDVKRKIDALQIGDAKKDHAEPDAPLRASEASAGRAISRRALMLALGAAALSAAAVAVWKLDPPRTRSVAVLPFSHAPADDRDAEAFAVGMTDNLIRKIAGIRALSVKSRSAALSFDNTTRDPLKFGQRLGVAAIVTGSVVHRSAVLHITAELVDVKTAAPLWGPVSYDRDEGDVLLIEDELATAIVEDGIRLKLSPNDRNGIARHDTNDREADKLYRLALAHFDRETKADNLMARDLLLKAIDRDPKFARAYAAIARTYGSMVIDGLEPPEEGFRQMKLYTNNALLLDPTISDVHGLLGTELFWKQRRWREAEQQFKIAMQSPGAPAVYEPYVWLLLATKRGGAALALARRAQEDDPVSLKWRLREADILLSLGRVEEAEKAYQNVVRDSPEDFRAYLGLANIKRIQKQFPAAIKLLDQAYRTAGETDPRALDILKTARGEEGYLAIQNREAELELEHLQMSAAQYVSSLDFARAHARLGHKDQAFSYLQRAFAEGSPGLALLNVDPVWESIRDDPRFAQAAARAALP